MKRLLTFVFLISSIASADVLTDIKTANPTGTAFQVLERLYLTAKAPADLSDFDEWGKPSDMRCAGAGKSDETPFAQSAVPKTYKVLIPGEQGQGPLFPDSPATFKTVLLQIAVESSWLTKARLNTYIDGSVLEKTATDLKLYIKSESDFDQTQVPATIWYRKNENYIAIKSVSGNRLQYDYCWRPVE